MFDAGGAARQPLCCPQMRHDAGDAGIMGHRLVWAPQTTRTNAAGFTLIEVILVAANQDKAMKIEPEIYGPHCAYRPVK